MKIFLKEFIFHRQTDVRTIILNYNTTDDKLYT